MIRVLSYCSTLPSLLVLEVVFKVHNSTRCPQGCQGIWVRRTLRVRNWHPGATSRPGSLPTHRYFSISDCGAPRECFQRSYPNLSKPIPLAAHPQWTQSKKSPRGVWPFVLPSCFAAHLMSSFIGYSCEQSALSARNSSIYLQLRRPAPLICVARGCSQLGPRLRRLI